MRRLNNMSIVKNRYEIMALVEAKMCNPNGDPDMGNRPRIDYGTGHGIITDVAFKSRMRAYVADAYANKDGYNILIQRGVNLNRNIAEAVLEVSDDKVKTNAKTTTDAAMFMANKYWDVRTFGGVLSTGLNAGQVRGAVQVGMAISVDEIEVEDITITRMAFVDGNSSKMSDYDKIDEEKSEDKRRTMGTKQYTPYGLYVLKMTVSANLAEKVGFTEEDLKVLLESVMQMYDVESSSSKMGMSVLTPVVVFKHVGTQFDKTSEDNIREAKLGCAPAYKLFDLLKVMKRDDVDVPRDHSDYNVVLELSKLPNGVECGLKTSVFGDIEWQDNSDKVLI